ncbi:purine-nucleoside phosphorylase [Bacteroidota bacterium]
MLDQVLEAVKYIRERTNLNPDTGIVLGTGLGGLADEVEQSISIGYEDIPGFSISTIDSHRGSLVLGFLSGKCVIIMQGRFHYYEGYNMKEITFPIRVMKMLGIKNLFVSNASGGLNHNFNTGDLMLINDHINFFPENPLRGENFGELGPRFPDMTEAYSSKLISLAIKASVSMNFKIHQGLYLGLQGPSFETPAEYNMFRNMGADAIGMSTVPEIIVARHMGIKCMAISVISNLLFADKVLKVNLDDIMNEAYSAETKLTQIFKYVLDKI